MKSDACPLYAGKHLYGERVQRVDNITGRVLAKHITCLCGAEIPKRELPRFRVQQAATQRLRDVRWGVEPGAVQAAMPLEP